MQKRLAAISKSPPRRRHALSATSTRWQVVVRFSYRLVVNRAASSVPTDVAGSPPPGAASWVGEARLLRIQESRDAASALSRAKREPAAAFRSERDRTEAPDNGLGLSTAA
jgi:hypothetical protein